MRTAFSIPSAVLGRAVRVADTLRPANGRRVLLAAACLCAAGAGTPAPGGSLAAEHYARRQPTIQRAIRRHLAYAAHETVRNIEEAGHRTNRPLHAAEGDSDPEDRSGAGGVAADLAFDPARFAGGLIATLRNESARGLQTAGDQLFEELGDAAPVDPFRVPDPEALRYLDGRENLLKGVPDDIHAQVVAALKEGLEAGDSTRDLARRIRATFAAIGEGRAKTIASTETAAAYGFARQTGMTQAGIGYKTWLTSRLKNVRLAHSKAERDERNRHVPVDQPFVVGGERLMYPGDPAGSAANVINCHCVSIARPA